MIKKIEIENYKSLENLSMELGRFNVLIGENGCGKTNILESLVFAAAGVKGTIENNFFALRGGRNSEAHFLRSGFEMKRLTENIKIDIGNNNGLELKQTFNNDNQPFSKWVHDLMFNNIKLRGGNADIFNDDNIEKIAEINIEKYIADIHNNPDSEFEKNRIEDIAKQIIELQKEIGKTRANQINIINKSFSIIDYIIFAPENYFLRNININETYSDPVGSRGEGLLKLIKIIKKEKPEEYKEIISHLHLIDWFDNFDINEDFNADSEFTLSDKYLEDGLKSFDIRNANEGFLFVLFYLTIFISDYTPKFFAIDNIDTALNPKLCSKLISVLVELAKKHDKQVIITTHNPSVLDGLNLNDDEQRLFVIARNKAGRTKATRIDKKPAINGTEPVKLSEQFLRGYIGGLPKNF